MKTAACLVMTLLCGSVLASTPDAIQSQGMTVKSIPVVEVHPVTSEQIRALTDAREDYRRELEALEQSHQEKVETILGQASVKTRAI